MYSRMPIVACQKCAFASRGAPQRRLEHPRHQPVQHAEGHEADPAQHAGMHVGDRPVGVVGQGVDALDRQQRAFKRGHPVERDPDDEELEDRLRRHLGPRPAERQQPVDHAAPGRHPEHDRKQHAQRRSPFGRRGIVQVVRAGPDVDENQRPEVDDAQPIRIHRPPGRFGQVVVHQAEERRGEHEADRVVAVPPLHKRVLDARVHRVALQRPGRHLQAVENVQNRDGHDGCDVEPEGDVHVPLAAFDQRAKEVDRKHDPDHGDRQVDGPLQLGVFFAGRKPGGQRHRRRHDNQLPTPEMKPTQRVAEQAGFAQPLSRVVDGGKHRVARERKDRGVGVQRSQPAERSELQPQVQLGPRQSRRQQATRTRPRPRESSPAGTREQFGRCRRTSPGPRKILRGGSRDRRCRRWRERRMPSASFLPFAGRDAPRDSLIPNSASASRSSKRPSDPKFGEVSRDFGAIRARRQSRHHAIADSGVTGQLSRRR